MAVKCVVAHADITDHFLFYFENCELSDFLEKSCNLTSLEDENERKHGFFFFFCLMLTSESPEDDYK